MKEESTNMFVWGRHHPPLYTLRKNKLNLPCVLQCNHIVKQGSMAFAYPRKMNGGFQGCPL